MNSLLSLWDAIAVAVAVVLIVVTAIGMMIGLVDLHHALNRIGLVIGCLVLLLILPPIIVNIWYTLSLWQRLGIIALALMMGISVLRGVVSTPGKKDSRH